MVQPKLLVGDLNDPLEHEADHIADQGMQRPEPSLLVSSAPPAISRKCETCRTEEDVDIQMRPASYTDQGVREAPPLVLQVLGASAQPLDTNTRTFFEPRFHSDFSAVRVHDDAPAHKVARTMSAQAFTVGYDIVFGAGHYMPDTEPGRRLLAHELTHVLQQSHSETPQADGPNRRTDISQLALTAGPGAQIRRQQDTGAPLRDAGDTGGANVPTDGGQDRLPDIEWTSQGSKPGAGVTTGAATVTTSPEITLETGNVGAGPGNNLLHQQICVDDGTGKDCFSFAAIGIHLPQFSLTWLGWSWPYAGTVLRGQVYNPGPVPGATIVSRHSPTAAQAAKWRSYMRGTRLGLQDAYVLADHNCRKFSQFEFRDAPSHW
jgi:Domain of unknown function (DUF4157)